MKVPRPDCDFCSEFSGNAQNAFDRIYHHDPKSRVLFRSKDFVVLPSLGQIAEGHLLLLPIRHWTAFGDLAESLLGEFRGLSTAVTTILREEYGSCVTFEHGVRSGSLGGCGIYHAHMHAVPVRAGLDPLELLTSQFEFSESADLTEIREKTRGSASYLFYQDSRGRGYVFRTGMLPSQYMRKLLAERLGNQDWDWRAAGREERLVATLSRLAKRFSGHVVPAEFGEVKNVPRR